MAVPGSSDLRAPFLWANELLQCACEALTLHAPESCPDRACVYNGGVEVAFDDCCDGQLWVAWGATYPSERFPDPLSGREQQQKCLSAMMVMNFEVGIVRCAPSLDSLGHVPTCEEIEASAIQMFEEAQIILRAVTCCIKEWQDAGRHAIWTEQVPAGDEGACVGSVLRVTIGMGLCTCIPDPEPEP